MKKVLWWPTRYITQIVYTIAEYGWRNGVTFIQGHSKNSFLLCAATMMGERNFKKTKRSCRNDLFLLLDEQTAGGFHSSLALHLPLFSQVGTCRRFGVSAKLKNRKRSFFGKVVVDSPDFCLATMPTALRTCSGFLNLCSKRKKRRKRYALRREWKVTGTGRPSFRTGTFIITLHQTTIQV